MPTTAITICPNRLLPLARRFSANSGPLVETPPDADVKPLEELSPGGCGEHRWLARRLTSTIDTRRGGDGPWIPSSAIHPGPCSPPRRKVARPTHYETTGVRDGWFRLMPPGAVLPDQSTRDQFHGDTLCYPVQRRPAALWPHVATPANVPGGRNAIVTLRQGSRNGAAPAPEPCPSEKTRLFSATE